MPFPRLLSTKEKYFDMSRLKLLAILALMISTPCFAPPPPPGSGNTTPMAPIDGGIVLLAIAGVAVGATKKLREQH